MSSWAEGNMARGEPMYVFGIRVKSNQLSPYAHMTLGCFETRETNELLIFERLDSPDVPCTFKLRVVDAQMLMGRKWSAVMELPDALRKVFSELTDDIVCRELDGKLYQWIASPSAVVKTAHVPCYSYNQAASLIGQTLVFETYFYKHIGPDDVLWVF
jgi:hypothetical protein